MKVWVLKNQQYSGVFSTKEKALESLRNYFKRTKPTVIKYYNNHDFITTIIYHLPTKASWDNYAAEIIEFDFDKDYNEGR